MKSYGPPTRQKGRDKRKTRKSKKLTNQKTRNDSQRSPKFSNRKKTITFQPFYKLIKNFQPFSNYFRLVQP